MSSETKIAQHRFLCTDEEALGWLIDGKLESENKAISCLYRRLLGMILPWVYSKNGSSEDAHDAVTEAIIKFVQNFREGKYKEQGKLEHFLFRIAQRRFYDLLRGRKDDVSIETAFPGGIPPEVAEEDRIEIAEKEVEDIAKLAQLEHCMSQIGERCKERINRYWHMKQSHEEIAAAMGDASTRVSITMKNKCQGKLEKCLKP